MGAFLMAGSVAAQTVYHLQDLGAMGVPVFHGSPSDFGTISAINNAGQAVGWTFGNNTIDSVTTKNGGPLTPLPLPTPFQIEYPRNAATAINNNGQIAGTGQVLAANGYDTDSRGFIISGTQKKTIGLLDGVTRGQTYVNGINDSGMVTGSTTALDWNQHAYVYNGSTMQDLGSVLGGAGSSVGKDINNLGVVVGEFQDNDGKSRAFAYDGHTATVLSNTVQSTANAINDQGQIVGSVYTNAGERAFLYEAGVMKDLGTLGGVISSAYGINASGMVVGMSTVADKTSHAFLYDGTSMVDLATLLTGTGSGWLLLSANGINDQGQIVGRGYYNGEYRGFILNPTAVPEPTTLVLMGLGLGGMVTARRRAQKA